MMSKPRPRAAPASTAAVAVRLVAFLAAIVAAFAIPTALIATATGHLSLQSALVAMAFAAALIVASAVAVRPFDPL